MSANTVTTPAGIDELTRLSTQVRRDILRMTHGAGCGHPGGSLGCADLLSALYFNAMELKPDFDMHGRDEDIFFLSIGHISPVWYSILARKGYFDVSELSTFRMIDSRLQGHPATAEGLPGVRMASGSLGQGLSVALGAAWTKKLNGDKHLVYSLHGDGEMEEGQNWEALMFGAHHKVDNLIAIIDRNYQQIDGPTTDVLDPGDMCEKLQAFGWHCIEMQGNDMADVLDKLQQAKEAAGNGKPVGIVMYSAMGKGVDFMEDNYKWHGVAPNDDQLEKALAQLPETLGDY